MQVDADVRIVVAQQARQRSRFGRLELHVIAIEIEILRVRPTPDAADRAVLQRTLAESDALVAVGVVDRRDEQHERVEPGGMLPVDDLAQQDLQRFLALDFAGVDVALHVDAGQTARAHGLR